MVRALRKNPHGKLERKIIAMLARGPAYSAADLFIELQRTHTPYSLQAVYYVLRKLCRDGVAVRVQELFSLSLPWSLELLELAKALERNFIRNAPSSQLIPPLHGKCSWSFTNLYTLDDVWVQMMLLLLEKSSENIIWNYCPHPWFYYGQPQKMERFFRVLRRNESRIYVLIGGNTKLDRLFSQSMSKELYRCKHVETDTRGLPDFHIMVIGDYVIKVSMRSDTSKAIDLAFQKASSGSATDTLLVQHAANARTSARLTVQHSSKQSIKWRKIFAWYFRD